MPAMIRWRFALMKENQEVFNQWKDIGRYYIYRPTGEGVGSVLSDDELVEQIQDGDENAAEELIKRYYTSILRYCKWHCSNLERAEDLTQETFLKLFKNIYRYKGKKKFKASYIPLRTICVLMRAESSRPIP